MYLIIIYIYECRELMWLTKPKIFTVWPCMENVYQSLTHTNDRNKDSKSPKLSFICSKSKFRKLHPSPNIDLL